MLKVFHKVKAQHKCAYKPIKTIYNELTPELEEIIRTKQAPCITQKGKELLGKVKVFKITKEEII